MQQLKTKELTKVYKSRTVVQSASVTINQGEIVGLLGPNGAGKTTTFYMIVGFIKPKSGDIYLDDTKITHLPMYRRARKGLSYLPQEPSIFRQMSVQNNILAILELRKELTKAQRQEKLDALLDEFHITHLRHERSMSLSGGERRRLEIARALATDPSFILLDEPFAGVDPISIIDIKRMIQHLAERKIGVLITDHNVRETLAVCHRAYIMNAGSIIATGTPKEVLANQEVKAVYLGDDFEIPL